MDLNTLYSRCVESWAERVNAVAPGQWDDRTPCVDWNVRDLTNHLAGEDLWTIPLIRGKTIEEVGDEFDGDLLGDDPVAVSLKAAADATSVVAEVLPAGGKVHLSYGEEEMSEYVYQLSADHLIHAWDLAAATGGDTRLDPDLVAEIAEWFGPREEMLRSVGAFGARRPPTGDAQGDLLAAAGRSSDWARSTPR